MSKWERRLLIVAQVAVGVILLISGIVAVISTDPTESSVKFICALFSLGVAVVLAYPGKGEHRWT